MIKIWRLCLAALLSASFFPGPALAAPREQAAAGQCPAQDTEAVANALREMYAALSLDDEARLTAVFAPGFYAFDLGKRFDAMELAALIKAAHAAGKTYVWTVNEPDVHVVCDRAWIAYVNRGSVSDAAGAQPRTWVESAVLRHDGGRWRIEFFHSTRAPATP